MTINISCIKCGGSMSSNNILRSDGNKLTQHYCNSCGYHYESGFRYNSLTKQYIKYIRFNS